MADLISREAAIETVTDWNVNPGGEIFAAIKIAIRSKIEQLPTIEAIPVNWISAYMNKSYGRVRAEIIREMLDAWMEQEAR